MADKLRTANLLEALQARYVGTGHADTTRHEWESNIVRDTYASYIGHPPLLQYMGIGMGECRERTRVRCLEGAVRGAGPGPGLEGEGEGGGEGDGRRRSGRDRNGY